MPIIQESSSPRFEKENENDPGLDFWAESSLSRRLSHEYHARVERFMQSPERISESQRHFKRYLNAETIPLTEAMKLPSCSLSQLLHARKSSPGFSDRFLLFEEFSTLLSLAYGAQGGETARDRVPHMTVPSGGARFPLEIYPIVLNVESLPSGIYHYNPKDRVVERLPGQLTQRSLESSVFDSKLDPPNAAAIIVVSAVFERTTRKYGPRGWRSIYAEAGCLLQNFYLIAAAMKLGCRGLLGIQEDSLARLLGLNKRHEVPLLAVRLGPLSLAFYDPAE